MIRTLLSLIPCQRYLLALTLVVCSAFTAYAQPTNGLVAHWPFTGNTNDASGNGHNGNFTSDPPRYVIGAPTLTTDRFGNPRRAYSFDGVDDAIRVPHHPQLNLPSNFTISGWFRTCEWPRVEAWIAGKSPSNYRANATIEATIPGYGLVLLYSNNSEHAPLMGSDYGFYFLQTVDSNTGRVFCAAGNSGRNLVADNKWHHVVYIVDFSNRMAYMYVDDGLYSCSTTNDVDFNQPDVTNPTNYNRSLNTNDVYIGLTYTDPYESYLGDLDDIRMYDRALTRAEVTALYREGGWPATAASRDVGLSLRARNDTVICPGDSVYLDLSHLGDFVRWSTLDGVTEPESDTPVLSPEETTTYEITAYKLISELSCPDTARQTKEITIVVQEAPRAEAGQPAYLCAGSDVVIGGTTSGGTPPYRWQWSPAIGLDDPTAEQPTLTVTGNATYELVVTDAKGCRDIDTLQVTMLDAPEVQLLQVRGVRDTVVADTVYYCRGSGGAQLIAQPSGSNGPFVLTWLQSTGLDRTDTTHVIARPDAITTYQVVVDDRAGICTDTAMIVVLPVDPPSVNAGENTRICPTESTRLGDDANNPNLIYTWTPATGLDNATLPRPTATPASTTTYYLTATDTLTGCIGVDSTTVTVEDIQLTLDASSIDFGALDGCRSDTTIVVTITNAGASAATLFGLRQTSGPVSLVGAGVMIPATGSANVQLRFAPGAAGTQSGELTLLFGPCDDSLVIGYTGRKANASVGLDRSALTFARVADCEVVPEELGIEVTNNGTDPATIEPGVVAAPFTVSSPALPVTVAAGGSATLTVRFAPTGAGTYSDELRLPFTSGTCSDTLRVALDGEVVEPALAADGAGVDFGLLDGCTSEGGGTVVVRNPGMDRMDIMDVEMPAGISVLNPPSQIDGGGSVALQLRYTPGSTGVLNDNLRVIYGPCPDTLVIPLSGEKRGVSFATADTLRFDEVCVGGSNTVPLDVLLNSEGSGNGSVVSAVVSGPFSSDVAAGAQLLDGTASTFNVSFTPNADGSVVGELVLRLEPCDIERRVVLIGTGVQVDLAATPVAFGTQAVGTTTMRQVVYTNNGASTITVGGLDDAGFAGGPFMVTGTTPGLPTNLAPGERLTVDVEFGATTGMMTVDLGAVVSGACDTTIVATITGTGESSGFAQLALPSLSGAPGDELALTLRVTDAAGIPAEGIPFTAEVAVEASILVTADRATAWSIVGNERIIELTGVITPENEIAASIPVTTLLGRVESSALRLVSLAPSDAANEFSLSGTDGSVTILGLCREGGTRLFDPTNEIAIKSITPSPTSGSVTITYALSESGTHRLLLIDAAGREIHRFFDGTFVPGTYELSQSLDDISSGGYRLILQTPTTRLSQTMIIAK